MLYSALDSGYFNQDQFHRAFDLTVRIEQTLIKFIKSISIYETKDAVRRT